MKVILELTDKEAEKLSEQMDLPDIGCCEDMWCSAELTYLRDKVDQAIAVASGKEIVVPRWLSAAGGKVNG